MTTDDAKSTARDRVRELVERFRRNETDYLAQGYNETQARTDFITPLLEAFGWDVRNETNRPLSWRDVVEEATVEVASEPLSKKPDYELRVARQRKLFVEAKKPSVSIEHDRASAFQVRRYGYSGSLPIAVLTNFNYLAVYDCQPIPDRADQAHVGRIALVKYDQFDAQFDELWSYLSRDEMYSGAFDQRFGVEVNRQGTEQFDELFLGQVRSWRERLAVDIQSQTPNLSAAELTYAVQLFLSRLVFLRICEDRELEVYETLKELAANQAFEALKSKLREADEFYDSGLFRLLDDERLGIRISDEILRQIIAELYYPLSPYTFAVVETEVLGEIYEQFLGEVITVENGVVTITTRPEVRESGGVVPTPRHVVDVIVDRALQPALDHRSPTELEGFTVADPCCGSGVFLLSAYERLMDHYLSWYLANDRESHVGHTIYEASGGEWKLTFDERRRIVLEHIRGVDIDASAIEVAQFSLLLKLIEDETAGGLREYVRRTGHAALPELDGIVKVGNSLVDPHEWTETTGSAIPRELYESIIPFSWWDEFPNEHDAGGFDVVVGNPPYIRIQHMANYSPDEVSYYQHDGSPYDTARQNNFDKYELFIERAIQIAKPTGRIGYIVPHKFMITRAGRAIRSLISSGRLLEQIVHFGAKPVFGRGVSNYTCILILNRAGRDAALLERVSIPLERWRYGEPGTVTQIAAADLGEGTWQFANAEVRELFQRVRADHAATLEEVADIFVGVQTSADDIFIFAAADSTEDTVTLRWQGQDWPIERGVIRPCLIDVRLDPYQRPRSNAWMIFPYELIPSQSRTRARLIQPDEMRERFPGCLAYLTARREELEQRNIMGGAAAERQFYQFGRAQSLTQFEGPKIILPVLSIEPRYALDDQQLVVTGGGNGPYYMVRSLPSSNISNYFLLAILNHPLSESIVRSNTSVFRGGYYSHGKQYIKDLPIPTSNEEQRNAIDGLVADLISELDRLSMARTPQERMTSRRRSAELRSEIEQHVSALFGLTPEELDIARSVPIPD